MDVTEDNGATAPQAGERRNRKHATPPQVPARARVFLSVGTFAGLFCAEAMSSMRLFSLGEHAGYPPFLAWLLPGALDVYALTLVWFFSLLPAEHPLRRKAAREAALALGITVACNALDEIVAAFARQLPYWAPGVLFVLISALAPFVAYRLIHFRAEIGNDTTAANAPVNIERQRESANKPPERQRPAKPPTANKPPANASANANRTGNGRADDEWIAIAKPVYTAVRDRLGKRPTEGPFHAALADELERLTAAGQLEPGDAPSLGTAKRVRGLVEAAHPELAPRIHLVAS